MRLTVALLAVALAAQASQPGQPLDCSDWVFNDPGLYCTMFVAIGQFPLPGPGLPPSELSFKAPTRVWTTPARCTTCE